MLSIAALVVETQAGLKASDRFAADALDAAEVTRAMEGHAIITRRRLRLTAMRDNRLGA